MWSLLLFISSQPLLLSDPWEPELPLSHLPNLSLSGSVADWALGPVSETWVQVPGLLSELVHPSGPRSPHLQREDNVYTHLTVFCEDIPPGA